MSAAVLPTANLSIEGRISGDNIEETTRFRFIDCRSFSAYGQANISIHSPARAEVLDLHMASGAIQAAMLAEREDGRWKQLGVEGPLIELPLAERQLPLGLAARRDQSHRITARAACGTRADTASASHR